MPIGQFGTIVFEVPQTLSVSGNLTYPFIKIPKVAGYPALQIGGDELDEISLNLRFNEAYNQNPNPQTAFDNLVRTANLRSRNQLTIGKKNYGFFVIQGLRFSINLMTDNGDALTVNCDVSFLASPT